MARNCDNKNMKKSDDAMMLRIPQNRDYLDQVICLYSLFLYQAQSSPSPFIMKSTHHMNFLTL